MIKHDYDDTDSCSKNYTVDSNSEEVTMTNTYEESYDCDSVSIDMSGIDNDFQNLLSEFETFCVKHQTLDNLKIIESNFKKNKDNRKKRKKAKIRPTRSRSKNDEIKKLIMKTNNNLKKLLELFEELYLAEKNKDENV